MLFDTRLDKLGDIYVYLEISKKYGITFSEYLEMIRSGRWKEVTDIDARHIGSFGSR